MNPKDGNDAALRKAVAERLRRFFAHLTAQFAAGTADIWSRVERRLAHGSPGSGATPPASDFKQQPVQQQQKKAEDPKETGSPTDTARRD
jgi:hypothetical protein